MHVDIFVTCHIVSKMVCREHVDMFVTCHKVSKIFWCLQSDQVCKSFQIIWICEIGIWVRMLKYSCIFPQKYLNIGQFEIFKHLCFLPKIASFFLHFGISLYFPLFIESFPFSVFSWRNCQVGPAVMLFFCHVCKYRGVKNSNSKMSAFKSCSN